MGTVKPTYVKKMAKLLLEKVNSFTEDFEENKKLVEQYLNTDSKEVRNRVAGYITRIKRHGKPEVWGEKKPLA
ncbi:MAG: 30S ribosomal protein S17e [Canidatus Methanoxibalbensis ujae]|nr:30S ribosomal protein S17e [Candidatus Methanoxibalbensis ujae]